MTTKKIFLLSLAMALLPLSSVCVSTLAGTVYLQVRIEDPNDSQDSDPRSPVLIPEVSIEDYTLYFDTPCDGCILRVVNELGVAEYTTVIPVGADELVLPSYLSGEYELQIIRDNLCFYGDITL
jgi:hypothetical protein